MTTNRLRPATFDEWKRDIDKAIAQLQRRRSGADLQSLSQVIESGGALPPDYSLVPAAPVELVVTTDQYASGGTAYGRIYLSFAPVTVSTTAEPLVVDRYEMEIREQRAEDVEQDTWRVVDFAKDPSLMVERIDPTLIYEVRARAFTPVGRAGLYSAIVVTAVVDDTIPPGVPTTPLGYQRLGIAVFYWDGMFAGGTQGPPPDFSHVMVGVGTDEDPIVESDIRMSGAGYITFPQYVPGTVVHVALRAYDISNNASVWSGPVSVTTQPVVGEDLVAGAIQAYHLDVGVVQAVHLESVMALVSDLIAGGVKQPDGSIQGEHARLGGTGLEFLIPNPSGVVTDPPVPIQKYGRGSVVFDPATREILSDQTTDGGFIGRYGHFNQLSVADRDLHSYLNDLAKGSVVDVSVNQVRGSYYEHTGYFEVAFDVKPNRHYLFVGKIWLNIGSGEENRGTYFGYIRLTFGNPSAPQPLVTSLEIDGGEADFNPEQTNAPLPTLVGGWNSTDAGEVRALLTARGGGTTPRRFWFVIGALRVYDMGPANQSQTDYKWNTGLTTDPVSAPARKREQWFDFEWSEVYNQFGAASHPPVDSELRQGANENVNNPYASLAKIAAATKSALSGKSSLKLYLQATNIGWQSGNAIIGYTTTALGGIPATMPTTTGHTAKAVARGDTPLIELPAAFATAMADGTLNGISLGRTGTRDPFLYFANITASTATRLRLYATWVE